VSTLDELTGGPPAALKQAGLSSKVKLIYGNVAGAAPRVNPTCHEGQRGLGEQGLPGARLHLEVPHRLEDQLVIVRHGTEDVMVPALTLEGLSRAFQGAWALRDVNLEVRRGEVHALPKRFP
jgi:hypothetical protein